MRIEKMAMLFPVGLFAGAIIEPKLVLLFMHTTNSFVAFGIVLFIPATFAAITAIGYRRILETIDKNTSDWNDATIIVGAVTYLFTTSLAFKTLPLESVSLLSLTAMTLNLIVKVLGAKQKKSAPRLNSQMQAR